MNKIEERYRIIRTALVKHANPAIEQKYSRYFREGYDAYGVERETIDKLRTEWMNEWSKDFTLKDYLALGEKLMASGKYEEAGCAIRFVEFFREEFQIEHLELFGRWLEEYVINWGHTDVISGLLISHFLQQKIVAPEWFDSWLFSKTKWKRRAVPVSFLSIIGQSDTRELLRIIEPIMEDKEDMVQKGIGWFLREAWKQDPEPVEEFLMVWKDRCPRLIVQYATEKMDSEYKKKFKKTKT